MLGDCRRTHAEHEFAFVYEFSAAACASLHFPNKTDSERLHS